MRNRSERHCKTLFVTYSVSHPLMLSSIIVVCQCHPTHAPSSNIFLAKINILIPDLFISISCITEARTQFTSDIEVFVSDQKSIPAVRGTARSPDRVFAFVDPYLTSFSPRFGPQSGGTVLTITGKHLDIGSSRSVRVDHLPCHIKR